MRLTVRGERAIMIWAGTFGLSLGFFFPWEVLPWN